MKNIRMVSTLIYSTSYTIARRDEEDNGCDRGRVRGVWPHHIGDRDRDRVITYEGDAGVHRHFQCRGSWPAINHTTNEFVYLEGNVNHNADMSIGVDWRIRNAWCSFRKYTLELYDRPSAPIELKIRMLIRAKVLETMLYGCVTRSPGACHYDTLPRAQHSFLTRCIGWRKNNRTDHPISYLDTLMKTGSEGIEVIMSRRRILFAGFVTCMEDTRLPKCVTFGELVGGVVYGREQEK